MVLHLPQASILESPATPPSSSPPHRTHCPALLFDLLNTSRIQPLSFIFPQHPCQGVTSHLGLYNSLLNGLPVSLLVSLQFVLTLKQERSFERKSWSYHLLIKTIHYFRCSEEESKSEFSTGLQGYPSASAAPISPCSLSCSWAASFSSLHPLQALASPCPGPWRCDFPITWIPFFPTLCNELLLVFHILLHVHFLKEAFHKPGVGLDPFLLYHVLLFCSTCSWMSTHGIIGVMSFPHQTISSVKSRTIDVWLTSSQQLPVHTWHFENI